MGLSSLCLGWEIARQNRWTTQVLTLITCRYIYESFTISCRISIYGYKPSNWSCLTSFSCVFLWIIFNISIHEVRHNTTNWTDIVQRRSQSGAMENIYIKDNWFTSDIAESPSETPSQEPSVTQEKNNNTLTPSKFVPNLQNSTAREGLSLNW